MKKSLLILTHEFMPFRGGIGTYCENMANKAVEAGYTVTVFAPDYNTDNSALDMNQTFDIVRYSGGIYSTLQFFRVFWRLLKTDLSQFDIIHATDFPWICACHLLSKFTNINYIATVHGTEIYGFVTSKLTKFLNIRDTLNSANLITANSQFTANLALHKHPYLNASKVRVTLLGVSPYWFAEVSEDISVLRRLNINPEKKILLTVARLVSRKGHRSVLKALHMIKSNWKKQITYVIVGKKTNSEYEKELFGLAQHSGVEVIFTGDIATETVRQLYKRSWLYVMIGEHDKKTIEGFGLSYLEAAAQGLPSLATRVGGIPEVVLHDESGWLVDSDDPRLVSEALTSLLQSPERVEEMRSVAQTYAKSFTWEECVEKTYS